MKKAKKTVRSSKTRPKNAVVSDSFRGWWLYIDATDSRSKQSFWLIKLISDSASTRRASNSRSRC